MQNQKETAHEQRFNRMTSTPIHRLIPRMAIPTIASMLITSLYNMADTYFVSQLGTSASGAVGIVFSLMAMIQAMAFIFSVGAGSTASRSLGAKDYDTANRMVSTSFFSAFGCGVIVAILGEIFLVPLVRLLGATPTIEPYAVDYAKYILLGAPFIASSFSLNHALRSEGSAALAMVGLTTGGFLNIILDPIFIFTFGLGTAGAAIATILSQIVSFFLLLSFFWRGKSTIRIKFSYFTPSRKIYSEIFKIGSPSFFRQGLASAASVLLNVTAGGFGDAVVASMSIVTRIIQFIASVLMGYGQGFQPVCGFNYGARRYDRVSSAYWFCIVTGAAAMALLGVFFFTFAPLVLSQFRKDDAEVIAVGARALRFQCLTLPINAWVIITNMLFQSSGKAGKAAFMALARQGLCFMPSILILPRFLGVLGVQLAQPAADVVTGLIAIPFVIGMMREMKHDLQLCQPADTPIAVEEPEIIDYD